MLASFKVWVISGWVHLVLGFAIGWIVFKQPQWAKDALAKIGAWIKAKLHLS